MELNKAADAARKGDFAYFQALCAQPDVLAALATKTDEDGRSLLHSACSSGSLPLLQLLARQAGAQKQINAADEEGWAPLHTGEGADRGIPYDPLDLPS